MKLKTVIKKLQALEEKVGGDIDVIIDQDEHGYYNLEKVELKGDKETEEIFINLKSSNDT